ncbi:MAG TPA: FAD-binding oxidoreductase [Planctomycetes bacterium]|nr:FAD-binding oxidoreductase [Planctomycetota bacterium]HIN81015.1 FAD-binding oxidoreductase [Planctomycetota bacterium]
MAESEPPPTGCTTTFWGWGGVSRGESFFHDQLAAEVLCQLVREVPTASWLPRGAGCSYGDAALNSSGTLLRLLGSERIELDSDAGQVRVGAGMRLGDLLSRLVPLGWWVGGVPGFLDVTVGGIAAADAHGKDHLGSGSFGDQIEEIDLVTADGSRSRISRNRDGELFAATIGGMGLTGQITRLLLRLQKLPSAWMVQTKRRTETLTETFDRLEEMLAEHSHVAAWIDGMERGKNLGRGVVSGANFAERSLLSSIGSARHFRWQPTRPFPLVPALSSVFTARTVRCFNSLRWSFSPSEKREGLRPIAQALFPLESLKRWNRLYGEAGLFQHQCVLPREVAPEGVEEILRTLHESKNPPFLVVLKRLGTGTFPLSFPLDGWTLSCDLAASPSSEAVLRVLDERVAALGGRVYLAKDSTLTPALLERMYPRLGELREVRRRVDPEGRLASDLSRRLRI